MQRLPNKPDETPTSLFNPSLDSFTLTYDKQSYTLPAYGIDTFPKWLADRIANGLAEQIIGNHGIIKNHALDRFNLLKEIYVV